MSEREIKKQSQGLERVFICKLEVLSIGDIFGERG